MKTKIVSCHTAVSKPVKQEVNGTVILPPLVFSGLILAEGQMLDCFKWIANNSLIATMKILPTHYVVSHLGILSQRHSLYVYLFLHGNSQAKRVLDVTLCLIPTYLYKWYIYELCIIKWCFLFEINFITEDTKECK